VLGERENSIARLEEAVAAYREALKEETRERAPLQWAGAQIGLGDALRALGQRENSTARFEEAVEAYREALKGDTRERAPLQWAMSTSNQGLALIQLAQRKRDAAMAKIAIAQIQAARDVMRAGGPASLAAYYEAQLTAARTLAQQILAR
jgi:tetratricopeptide (TPR) repeat protein